MAAAAMLHENQIDGHPGPQCRLNRRLLTGTQRSNGWVACHALLAFLGAVSVRAVDCTPDGIALFSQSEVDSFQADHGPCDTLRVLWVEGRDSITNLDGLVDLVSIDQLRIRYNWALEDLSGLSGLATVGALDISQNALPAAELSGLVVAGEVSVHSNTQTGRISFPALREVTRDLQIRGSSVPTRVSLPSLTLVRGGVEIAGGVTIFEVDLSSLHTVGGMRFEDTALTRLSLPSLISVRPYFIVRFSPYLEELEMANLEAGFLVARSNRALSRCCSLAGPIQRGLQVTLELNAEGCSSVAEVEETCSSLELQVTTNGVDADDPGAGDAPQVEPGDSVSWAYEVTNTGSFDLSQIRVSDNQDVEVECPKRDLGAGETMTCFASALARDLRNTDTRTVDGVCGGQADQPLYENRGTVRGRRSGVVVAAASDLSHYCNALARVPALPRTALLALALWLCAVGLRMVRRHSRG